MPAVSVPLALRRTPRQTRSRETFDRILGEAAALLEDVGVDAFTTNLLAERSGIAVRAIYRYFPNKQALVAELARRMSASWRAQLDDGYALADPERDWQELWCGYLDRFVAAVRGTHGALAVLRAMRADPELRAIDDEANEAYVRDVAFALRKRKPTLPRAQANAIAHVLLDSAVGVIDTALEAAPAQSRRMLALLKAMHLALLEEHLND
jgi:AcrR family transcriptional regulator